MPEYIINRWDSVIPKGNMFPYPMVSFKPDKDFDKYIAENNGLFIVEFIDTDSLYEKKLVSGMVYNGGLFPNYRPNYFNETGNYVLVVFTNWLGYPKNNGKMILKGSAEFKDVKPEFHVPTPIEFYREPSEKRNLSTSQIYYVLLTIFLIFCGLLILPSPKHKH